MKIKVTEEDMIFGRRGHPWMCPLALAMKRETGWQATVSTTVLMLSHYDHGRLSWPPPFSVQEWIWRFDACLHVEPVEFDIPTIIF